jgi:hypothetical protein
MAKKERNINEERNMRDLEVIKPTYNRAGRACATPGQTHLQRFENAN